MVLGAVVVTRVWFYVGRQPAPPIRNVLLISIDTLRADHLSCYGYAAPTTPNIDALANEGVLFENVIAPVPLTLPSHCSMLTGTNPTYHGVHDNIMYRLDDESNVTLAELAREHGFTTGAIVSGSVLDARFGLRQGFESYDQVGGHRTTASDLYERNAGQTNRVALDWLDRHHDERFFLFLHYYDPHAPYDPPPPFASQYATNPYAGEIAYTDKCVGQIIARLKELDLYDSTLIVIVSDHGEMLGEHGEKTHDYFIYQGAIRVPLVIRVPGLHEPRRVKSIAGVIDVLPTVCGLLGIEPPPDVQGVDLTPALHGRAPVSLPGVYCQSLTPTKYGGNALVGIVTDRWKFIHTTRAELYDLTADPREQTNLVQAQPGEAARLQDLLKQMLTAQRRDVSARQSDIDPEVERKLGALGYTGSPVVEDFGLGRTRDDPKDLIGLHRSYHEVVELINTRQWAKAQGVARQVQLRRPQFLGGHLKLAEIAMRQGRMDDAIAHLQDALKIKEDHSNTHQNLGQALLAVGRTDDAIRHLRRAVELRPTLGEAHYGLGMALLKQGRPQSALTSLRRAVELSPNHPEMLIGVAWVMAAHPDADARDPARAVQLSLRAANLTRHRAPAILDTLAVAYAADGQFDQAAQTARQAMTLARDRGAANLARQIGARLRLYEQHQSYRDPTPAP